MAYSFYQPNTSAGLAWSGRTEALSETLLGQNPSGVMVTDATGKLEVVDELPAANLPASIEVTGDLTGATLNAQTAAVSGDVAAGSYNGVTMPAPAVSFTGVWVQQLTAEWLNVSGTNDYNLTLPTGVGWGDLVGLPLVWYYNGSTTVISLAQQSDTGTQENRWTVVHGNPTQIRFMGNLGAGSNVRIRCCIARQ